MEKEYIIYTKPYVHEYRLTLDELFVSSIIQTKFSGQCPFRKDNIEQSRVTQQYSRVNKFCIKDQCSWKPSKEKVKVVEILVSYNEIFPEKHFAVVRLQIWKFLYCYYQYVVYIVYIPFIFVFTTHTSRLILCWESNNIWVGPLHPAVGENEYESWD